MLARLQADGEVKGRGRLRVYLGMAPGVGKSYEMLEEAHRRVARGTDLVVGFVESHGRPLTENLLDGLESVPRREVQYRGVTLEELDTDAVIARRPAVALVDELAHTNAPGSERAKRWEDVDAIRDAGIDVITTCNVQHLESVADAVSTITGAPVHERLPDWILLAAEEVELVDMSPHALRQRMRHGNVYPPDRAKLALEKFFTDANLTALRELALRHVAEHVDAELEGIMSDRGIAGAWPVGERVMVVVDERPETRPVLRRAATLAAAVRAPLIAVTIQTDAVERMPRDRAQDLRENLEFAEELGATVVRQPAKDIVAGIELVAHERRATHVLMARELGESRPGPLRRSLADQIERVLPEVELHLIHPGLKHPEH